MNNPVALIGWMTVKLDWGDCGNVCIHARLSKFLVALGPQHIGKASLSILKIQVRLKERKTPINTLLILCRWMTCKMAVSFKLNHADFPSLLNSTVSKPVSSVFSLLSCTTISRSFSIKVCALLFKSLTKASDKPFPSATREQSH